MEEKILMEYKGINGKKVFLIILAVGIVLGLIGVVMQYNSVLEGANNSYDWAKETYMEHRADGDCGYSYDKGEYCSQCENYMENRDREGYVSAYMDGYNFLIDSPFLFVVIVSAAVGGLFGALINKAPWKLTEDKLIFGRKEKEIAITSLITIKHTPVRKSNYGVIQVSWGQGLSDFITLAYPPKQSAEGEEAAEYIERTMNPEAYARKKEIEEKGFRKRCKICGKIICYSLEDLRENERLRKSALLSSIGGIATAVSGHYAASATQTQTAGDEMSRMIDYGKCPSCGSRELVDLTDEDIAQLNTPQNPVAAVASASSADELKKYKDLLDNGIITQEEFDAKKKQLLGL